MDPATPSPASPPPAPPGPTPATTSATPAAFDAQARSTAGWRSPLAAAVSGLLLVEGLTGLWIYLAPFSVTAQAQVLLHTVAGLPFVVLYLPYQWRHWKDWWRQPFTAEMLLGYLLAAAVLVACASGGVLTWQAWAGPRIGRGWDTVHVVSGLVSLGLVAVHVLLAWRRRVQAARRDPALARARRRFLMRQPAWVALSFVAVPAVLAVAVPARYLPLPADYTLPGHAQDYDEYRGSPFAPTSARTDSGTLVNPEVLAHSATCGSAGCHEQILAEWQPSAHRFSAMNPPFQAVQRSFAEDREPAETRYCAGCHDPISLFAGAKDVGDLDLSAVGVDEGISCVVCHTISQVDQRGNADYVLTPPVKYLWEQTGGWRKAVSDFVVRAYPWQHLADYDRNLLRTPEFCGSCHKQFIPEALNRFGFLSAQNQYDEWRQSHWHTEDPDTDLSCRDCHMRLVTDSRDPGRGEAGDRGRNADDGAHRHHGTVATNLFMPELLKLPNWERHVELTRQWIQGETVLPEIAHLWPEGPVAGLKLLAPESAVAGEELSLRVVITNRKAGHNFVTGPLDFIRSWVHLRVHDAGGALVAEWGAVDPATRSILDAPGVVHEAGEQREQGTLVLEAAPVDEQGQVIRRHELWRMAGGKGKRVIFPKYSDTQVFRFAVPAGVQGPLTLTADLNYRRYRQEFLNLVVPTMEQDHGVFQPTVTQASDRVEVKVEATPRPSAAPPAAPGSGF